jgi:hypothetical protein
VSQPGLEPAVIAQPITVDPEPTDLGADSDEVFHPAVVGVCAVVIEREKK